MPTRPTPDGGTGPTKKRPTPPPRGSRSVYVPRVRPNPTPARLTPSQLRRSAGSVTHDGSAVVPGSIGLQGKQARTGGGTGYYASPTNEWLWEKAMMEKAAFPPLPPGPAGPGGNGGGSGGGGGGGPADDGGMGAFLTSLLNSGAMAPAQQQYVRDGGMYDKVGSAVAADQANAAGAYDRLDGVLAGFKNPYDGLQAQTAGGVDSSLQRYLASQGGDGRGLAAEGALTEAQGQQQTAAAQQLLSILGANEQAGQNSRLTQSGMGRANANYQLGAQQTGMNAALDRQEAARKAQIEQQNFQLSQQAQAAKLQMITQIAQLAAQFGQPMPDLASFGL